MQTKDIWPELLRRAQERLATKRQSERHSAGLGTPLTAIGARMAPFLRADLVKTAVIYQQADGWGVDILFDVERLPPGMPAVIGTPVLEPFATAELAIDAGVGMAMVLIVAAETRSEVESAAPPAFLLFGETLVPEEEALIRMAPTWDSLERRLGEEAATKLVLGLLRAAWESLTIEMTDGVPAKAARARLMAAVCLCIHARIPRYPPIETEPVSVTGRPN